MITTSNNPFIILCKSNTNKNIDDNFVKTLEAIFFLNKKNIAQLINETYIKTDYVSFDSDIIEYSPWIKLKIEEKFFKEIKDKDFNSVLEQNRNNRFGANKVEKNFEYNDDYHIGDFLFGKLSQNLRRLYSANRNGGKVPKELGSNIDQLRNQQKNIYKALQMIEPYIVFDKKEKIYNKIIFCKVKFCSSVEAFFYISLHEHLFKENEDIHLSFFKNKFDFLDIRPEVINEVFNLSYKQEKVNFINKIIGNLPNSFFKGVGLKLKNYSISKGNLMVDIFLHCAQNNINLSKEEKNKLFNSIMHQNGYLSRQVACEAINITNKIKNYIFDVDLELSQKRNILPRLINKNCVTNICFLLTKKLTDPNLFFATLNSNIEFDVQKEILNKFDFTDQKIIFTIAENISNEKDRYKKVKLDQFISLVGDKIENDTLSKILAIDISFIETFNSLYMTRKLKEELNTENINEVHPKNKKNKI